MTTWFTADLHLKHKNIIEYCNRPYASVWEMNEALIANWNEVVQPEDHIHVVGDFSLDKSAVEQYLKRLNGRKHLVAGNHDKCFKGLFNPAQYHWVEKYHEWGFETVRASNTIELPNLNIEIKISHFPYKGAGDHTYQERFTEYRLEDTRHILLHGHSHNPREKRCRMTAKGSLMIDVGVDANHYKPISLEEIETIIEEFYND